jgi:DNA-binding CsgD family transcriptional regulator
MLSAMDFVGRAQELEQLERALRRAQSGDGSALLVSGDAGIGKTRLAAELMARARAAGAHVLFGQGIDLIGAELPYLPLVEALRPVGVPPQLLGAADEEADRAVSRLRLFEELLERLTALSRSAPLLLVLDDLHWADDSSLDAAAFLAHNLADRRIVLLATARDEPAHSQRLQRFARPATVVELGPLADSDVEAVLAGAATGRARHELAAIAERSAGNPFFAEQLLAAAGAHPGVPRSLRDLLLQRVADLDPRAQQALRIAAAAGGDVRYRLLEAAIDLDHAELQAALRRAVEHGVLRSDQAAATLSFRHPLLAEAVYETLLPGEREALHRRLAETLAAEPDLGGAAELAHHWAVAGCAAEAFDASLRAAREAVAMSGFAEALRQSERALDLWHEVPGAAERAGTDLAGALEAAADLAGLAGEAIRAVELLERALDEIGETDRRRAGVVQSALGVYLSPAGLHHRVLPAHERAVALVPAEPPSVERARVLTAYARALMLGWRHEESAVACGQALTVARAAGARHSECHTLGTLGTCLCYLGRPAEGLEHIEASLRMARELGDPRLVAGGYALLSDALTLVGRNEEGARAATDGIEELARRGIERGLGAVLVSNAAEALFYLGDWDRAARVSERGLAQGGDWRNNMLDALVRVELGRGQVALARRHLEEAESDHARTAHHHAALVAELALLEGDPDRAVAILDEALERADAPDLALRRAELCALALHADADRAELARIHREPLDELRAAADAHLATAREAATAAESVTPVAAGWSALCRAEHTRASTSWAADAAAGDPAEAWVAAADVWAGLGWPYRVAYCRARQAEALVAAGASRLAAAVPAREAYAIATRLGARPLLTRLEQLAERARLDLSEPAAEEPAEDTLGLTPRELEVLALIARGMTNREIADALVISTKTVSVHVSNILAKLGVSSRVEAAAIAQRAAAAP